MRPIGFSTGALARGDVARGVRLQADIEKVAAVELSALREHELQTLVEAIGSLPLERFAYVSFHAPARLQNVSEDAAFDLLSGLPQSWSIVVHPELLRTPALWRRLGGRLCLENMDDRKTTGRTIEEMRELFAAFPEAGFCLDVGHARQVDPTMITALLMLNEFGDRLRQLHVSDVGPMGEHFAIGATARYAFARIARYVPAACPLIIESIVEAGAIEKELETVADLFAA